ncbi:MULTISPECIES: hypothetical protein [Pseudomonas]|uniref:Uncharacterized protein n=2 Tax=Pseudomonas TaxID=286 RepID=A0A423GFH6_9PSED|nr:MULTISPECIES: hypothetical protein [Pseudomonas]KIQ57615.1 hypothetical protein RL74_19980 [Pseudomonas fluorescens]ROM85932.1 hypothetical protein BK652_04975 [Pseudomonas brassicacearum]
MNHIKAIAAGLLLATQLIYPAAAFSEGTIILRDKDNAICYLPVPGPGETKNYSFLFGQVQCKDWSNRARDIELAEVPSATTILLTETGTCDPSNNNLSWILLKTKKKQSNTTIIAIEYLTTFQKNQIIEPALQMVDLNIKSEFRDKVSCIQIKTSAAPPAP